MKQSGKFSANGYRSLVTRFLDANYHFCDFSQKNFNEPNVIFRHDVDFSTKAARDLARLEADLGIVSTYFFLLRSPFYNIWNPRTLGHIEEVLSLGHKIGLHFDASLYKQDIDYINQAANNECEIMQKIIGDHVDVISFHRPVKFLHGLDQKIAGREHAYSKNFFEDFGYVSDSRGAWCFGSPDQHKAFIRRRGMQVLTHPIWWMTEGQNAENKIIKFVDDISTQILSDLESNCSIKISND